jgi:hypothetical protein
LETAEIITSRCGRIVDPDRVRPRSLIDVIVAASEMPPRLDNDAATTATAAISATAVMLLALGNLSKGCRSFGRLRNG